MRTLHAIALAGAAFAAAVPAAHAQQAGASSTIEVPGAQLPPYRLSPYDFSENNKGTYELSNGKYMRVLNRGRRYYAEISGERRAELIPVGRNVFIARDRDMMVLFDEVSGGRRNDVVIRPRRQLG